MPISPTLSCLRAGFVAATLAIGVSAASSQSASAFDFLALYHRGFEGLWKGVDGQDGSVLLMSIVKNSYGGEYDILLRDSFFSLCFSLPEFSEGRGVSTGTGSQISKGALQFDFTRLCFPDDDPSDGQAADPSSVELTLRSKGKILVMEFEPPLFLHRVSE